MSPGSSVVPVERYIGSCLISAVGYKKDRGYRGGYPCLPPHEYYNPGWAIVPAANNVRRPKKEEEERSPLSKLAIHTQGAPLIQTQRQQGRKNVKSQVAKPQIQPQEETPNENSLPRIIKPRKRRKKERKPQQTPETAIVTLKPYTPLCQEYGQQQPQQRQEQQTPEREPARQPEVVHQVSQVNETRSTCWCRYCDPTGSVWDSSMSKHVDDWPTLQVSSEIVTSPNGHRDIEIKFFSTPPPQHQVTHRPSPPISVTPPWQ